MYNMEPHRKKKVFLFSLRGISLVIHNTEIVILSFFSKGLSYLKQPDKRTEG